RCHCRADSGEHFTVRVQAFTGPKGQFITNHTGYRGTANAAEIRRLNHNGDTRGKFDFIATFRDYHRPQGGNVVQDSFDVFEHDAGLFLVSSQAHHGESLTDGDELGKVCEARNKTGDKGRDERLSTTAANDEIGFLAAAHRRTYAARVVLKNN